MRKKAKFDSNRKARSEAPPPHFLYRVSQPKMSSHLNEDAVKREPFDGAIGKGLSFAFSAFFY